MNVECGEDYWFFPIAKAAIKTAEMLHEYIGEKPHMSGLQGGQLLNCDRLCMNVERGMFHTPKPTTT